MKNCFNVVMPMLGGGTRMNGIQNTCKPLMTLPNRERFFLQALKSLESYKIKNLVLVVLPEYEAEFVRLTDRIHAISKCNSVYICAHEATKTPVETAIIGYKALPVSDTIRYPLILLDCDIYAELPIFDYERYSAGIFWFEDKNPNKSYIRVAPDDDSRVIEIVEKEVVSNKAVFGAYVFAPRIFGKFADFTCHSYISQVVEELLFRSYTVRCLKVSKVKNYGTQEEFQDLKEL